MRAEAGKEDLHREFQAERTKLANTQRRDSTEWIGCYGKIFRKHIDPLSSPSKATHILDTHVSFALLIFTTTALPSLGLNHPPEESQTDTEFHHFQ